jgi:hypothetical protein
MSRKKEDLNEVITPKASFFLNHDKIFYLNMAF